MNGRAFDAQVVLTRLNTTRGKLLRQYVCGRVTAMDGIDLALFDYDRHNAIYYFILNADEHIYMRYGGRDSRASDSYLNLRSLERALEQGLKLHEQYVPERVPGNQRPKPIFAQDIPQLAHRTITRNHCVECHLIADYENIQREKEGTLDKPAHLFLSPDIRALGIELDVPTGLTTERVTGSARSAGMKVGDTITVLKNQRVWTFGDLQHELNKVDRKAKKLAVHVAREGIEKRLELELPKLWWVTDLRFRHWTVDPRVYFKSRALTSNEKTKLNLERNSLASLVTDVDPTAELLGYHKLKKGDIVLGVDGVTHDSTANTVELFVKLNYTAGQEVTVDVLRDGTQFTMKLKTHRERFRK